VRRPLIEPLVAASARLAAAAGLPVPSPTDLAGYLTQILFAQGALELWDAFAEQLITERELRDATMGRMITIIAGVARMRVPAADTYNSRELELMFELALLGAPISEQT
jgi:hypothetical protein